MKILVVSPLLPSPSIGMRGVHTNEQFGLMRSLGHDVRAVVPVTYAPAWPPRASWTRRRLIPATEADQGVVIAHPRHLAGRALVALPGGYALQRALYWRALRDEVGTFVSEGGDVVHVHSSLLPGVVVGRTGRAKVVVSMWDNELYDVAPADAAARRSIRHVLGRADAVVYISEALRQAGQRLVGEHASHVIPLAIDEHTDLEPRPSEAFTVMTAARLIPRKHVDLVVRSVAALRRAAGDVRLVVAGDGPERPRLERLARDEGLDGAVRFLGDISNRAVFEALAAAHLFVLPSVRESLGTVYFEAMSLRVPVVGTRGEGISEHITHGVDGFLVQPGDLDALVNILRAMHDEPERRRVIAARAYELYDRAGVRWRDYVEAHLRVFASA